MREITEDQFRQYKVVQYSGLTNMTYVVRVAELSDSLTVADVLEIVKRCAELSEAYPFSDDEELGIREDAEELRSCFE